MIDGYPGATYTPPPTVTLNGTSSFHTDDVPGMAHYLISNGYDLEPNRSPYEYARLWYCGSLVVLYTSGTALVQGKPEPSLSLLHGLIGGDV